MDKLDERSEDMMDEIVRENLNVSPNISVKSKGDKLLVPYNDSFRNPLTLSIVPMNSSMVATIVADSEEEENNAA